MLNVYETIQQWQTPLKAVEVVILMSIGHGLLQLDENQPFFYERKMPSLKSRPWSNVAFTLRAVTLVWRRPNDDHARHEYNWTKKRTETVELQDNSLTVFWYSWTQVCSVRRNQRSCGLYIVRAAVYRSCMHEALKRWKRTSKKSLFRT